MNIIDLETNDEVTITVAGKTKNYRIEKISENIEDFKSELNIIAEKSDCLDEDIINDFDLEFENWCVPRKFVKFYGEDDGIFQMPMVEVPEVTYDSECDGNYVTISVK